MADAAGPKRDARADFVWRRLGSIVAVLPLGAWTFTHVWDNLAAYRGGVAWESAVTGHQHPAATIAVFVFVIAPLLLHTVWGLGRLRTSRPNNLSYGYFANLKYLLQRLSALGVLAFLGAHLWLAWIRPRLLLGHGETFADISYEMHHHTPTLVVYLLGTLGVAYHLGNGLSGFAMGWGLVATRRALRRFDTVALGAFLVLLAMSWAAIYALWRAGGA